MNVFTTEHPLASQPSGFDSRRYPLGSFVRSSLVLAGMIFPVLVVSFVCDVITNAEEIGAEYDFPESWPLFLVWVFFLCFVGSSLLVSIYRILSWYFRSKFSGGSYVKA